MAGVRSRRPQETFGGKNHQAELADRLHVGNEEEGRVRSESQVSNLVQALTLGVMKKEKISETGSHVENEVSMEHPNGDFRITMQASEEREAVWIGDIEEI